MTRTTVETYGASAALVRDSVILHMYVYGHGHFEWHCNELTRCDSRAEAWVMALKESNKRNARNARCLL